MTLDDIRGLATITIPEAGQVLGIGRDAAYGAASRGEIPVLSPGRAKRVPVPKLLALLGYEIDLEPEDSEAGVTTPGIRSEIRHLKAIRYDHDKPA